MGGYTLGFFLAVVVALTAATPSGLFTPMAEAMGNGSPKVESPQPRSNLYYLGGLAAVRGDLSAVTSLEIDGCVSAASCVLRVNGVNNMNMTILSQRDLPITLGLAFSSGTSKVLTGDTPVRNGFPLPNQPFAINGAFDLRNQVFKGEDRIHINITVKDSRGMISCVQFDAVGGSDIAFDSVALLAILQVIRSVW